MQVLYWYEGKTPYRLLETDQKPEVISDDNYRRMRVEYDYWWKGTDLDQDKYPVTYIKKLFRQKPRKHTSKSPSKTPSKRPQAAGSPTPATPATPSGSRSDTEKEKAEQEALADKDEGGADGAPATLTPHARCCSAEETGKGEGDGLDDERSSEAGSSEAGSSGA